MYSYKLSIEAENDVIRIYEYGFHEFGMIQADKYYEALYECFNKIASNFQNNFLKVKNKDVHKYPISRLIHRYLERISH